MASIIETVVDALQERLTHPKSAYPRRLAELLVKNALHAEIDRLVPLEDAIEGLREGLIDYVKSDTSLKALSSVIDSQLELLKQHDAPLADVLPSEFVEALRERARRPWSPASRSVLKALDHEPVRRFIADIVVNVLIEFTTAGRSGARSKARKGIEALLGPKGREVTERLREKAEQFAESAVSGVLHFIVRQLSDPKLAKQQSAMREAIVRGILSIEADDLAEELDKIDLTGTAALFRESLQQWLESKEGERAFEVWLRGILEPQWRRTLGEVLRENGLERTAKAHLPRIVESRVRAFAESEEFRRFVRDVASD